MAELKPDTIAASSCCSTEAQSTCCEPSEKAGCCGEERRKLRLLRRRGIGVRQ